MNIERDTDDIYQTLRDDFEETLPPEIARDLCGDAYWERFGEFICNRCANGHERGERATERSSR